MADAPGPESRPPTWRCAPARVRLSLSRVWAKDAPFGTELADVTLVHGHLSATGVAIGTDPCPYRLDYELVTAAEFITSRLAVRTAGAGWRRTLVLERTPSGSWSCAAEGHGDLDRPAAGGDLGALRGALDCDLGLSPLTNSMPVLRHGLHRPGGGQVDLLMAWVAVPELRVYPSRQRYAAVRREADMAIVRFTSLDPDTDFSADISFDTHGIVLDYPGIARVVSSA